MNVGKCEWFIPDAFYPEKDNGDYVSHEAVCVLNTGKTEARIDFTLYFEDRPPMGGFSAVCPGRAHAPCAPGSDSFRSGRRHSQRRPICDLRKEQRACRRTVQPVRYDAAGIGFYGVACLLTDRLFYCKLCLHFDILIKE